MGNLPYSITEEQLRSKFSEFGAIKECNLIIDKFSGQSKGFAFVEYENHEDAPKAIEAMDGYWLSSRQLKVNEARPRT